MSLQDEISLLTKLIILNPSCRTVFDGLTNRGERKEKVRVAVKQVSAVIYRVENGRRITIAQAFYRAYGEEL
jgi:hypothetical protein